MRVTKEDVATRLRQAGIDSLLFESDFSNLAELTCKTARQSLL